MCWLKFYTLQAGLGSYNNIPDCAVFVTSFGSNVLFPVNTPPLFSPSVPSHYHLIWHAFGQCRGKKGHAQEVWRISCKVGRGALIRHVHWKTFASGNVKRVTTVNVLQGKTKKLWCTFQAHKTKSKEEAVNCGISFHNYLEARSENQHT